jgi:hypothetical protein
LGSAVWEPFWKLVKCFCATLSVTGPNSTSTIVSGFLSHGYIDRAEPLQSMAAGWYWSRHNTRTVASFPKNKHSIEEFCGLQNGPGGHNENVLAKGTEL